VLSSRVLKKNPKLTTTAEWSKLLQDIRILLNRLSCEKASKREVEKITREISNNSLEKKRREGKTRVRLPPIPKIFGLDGGV